VTCHKRLRFATLRDVPCFMIVKSAPKRTLERKKREAEALKANMKKRKEQAAKQSDVQKTVGETEGDGQLED
jgi:hypothetical protein